MSSEPFLSRWSKRKQAARTAEPPPEDAVSPQAEPVASDAAPETAAPKETNECGARSEAELSAEEIAKLPSLEDLTADTDISMFLRKGVPEPLRNAALRRMWSLDPKIRDFVCEAREYAYDWNTPGGVPGSGPLPATEDVARMAARIVGGGKLEVDPLPVDKWSAGADPLSQNREQTSPLDPAEGGKRVVAPVEEQTLPTEEASLSRATDKANVIAPPSVSQREERKESDTPARQLQTDDPITVTPARRHGGAMPL